MISMFFGPYMGNFDNLMVGDQVAARHSEAVLLVIAKGIDSMPVDIRIMYKQALAQFKPDDQVVVGYAHAAAISVAPGRASMASGSTPGAGTAPKH